MKLFDPLRRKYIEGTPEEIVRQNIIQWLIKEKGVPVTHIMSEYSFTYNNLQYRADIIIFDKALNPLMFVECKAPDIPIDDKVVQQCIRYNNVLKVKYILATNGKTSYLCVWNQNVERYELSTEFPDYQQMLTQ